jgi:hypothetical protein
MMKKKCILILGCIALVASFPASALGVTVVIVPTGVQDAELIPQIGLAVYNAAPYMMRQGSWSGQSIDTMSIMTLPAISPGQLISASLRVPQPHALQSGGTNGLDQLIDIEHVDANDDTMVVAADTSGTTAALSVIARFHDGLNSAVCADYSCVKVYDVTDQVLADLNAGRASFGVRTHSIGRADGTYPGGFLAHMFPGVDSTAGFANNGMQLTLTYVPEPATAGLLVLGSMGLLMKRRRRIG